MTVGEVIAKLSKMDKDLPLWVDTEARCDQAHLYPVSGVWELTKKQSGIDKIAYLSLHI